MADEYTPEIIPLGSLGEAASAGSETAQEEQQLYSISPDDPGTTTGIWAEPDVTYP